MSQKVCFLSIDVEEDWINGNTIDHFLGVESLHIVRDILKKNSVRATLFCTGNVLQKYTSLLKSFEVDQHEMAIHGFWDHVNMLEQDSHIRIDNINKHIALFKNIFGKPPKGFRAVQNTIDMQALDILEQCDFVYDSSLISRYPFLKKYIGYSERCPRHSYHPHMNDIRRCGDRKILEIPLSPLLGGIQMQGRWIKKLKLGVYQILLKLYKPSLLSFSFHSWDIVDVDTGDIDVKFKNQLEDMIILLKKKGYVFKTGAQIFQEYDKKNTPR